MTDKAVREVAWGGRMVILTDKGPREVDWLEFDGRAWIADLYVQSLDGKFLQPVRIIAPRAAPGYILPAGPEILGIFQRTPLPVSLLEQGAIPPGIAPNIEVRESPPIAVRNPATLN